MVLTYTGQHKKYKLAELLKQPTIHLVTTYLWLCYCFLQSLRKFIIIRHLAEIFVWDKSKNFAATMKSTVHIYND